MKRLGLALTVALAFGLVVPHVAAAGGFHGSAAGGRSGCCVGPGGFSGGGFVHHGFGHRGFVHGGFAHRGFVAPDRFFVSAFVGPGFVVAPAPVWVPPSWAWNGFAWVWLPGRWAW